MANMTFKANLLPDNTAAQRELGSSTAKWAINGVADPKLTDTLPTINTTGTGNAITAISISGSTITVTKGASYNNYTYTLPTASSTTLGGIKVGTGLGISSGTLSVSTTSGTSTLAWNSEVTLGTVGGLAIKAKLPANPDTNTWRPIQVNGTAALSDSTTTLNLKAGSNVSISNSSGTVTIAATDTTYSAATTSTAGLMSAADKAKLDGIATSANNYTYTLPVATSSALGGVKIGYSASGKSYAVKLNSSNQMYVDVPWTDTTYSLSGLGGVGTVSASGTAPLSLSASKSGTTVTISGSVAAATTAAAGVTQYTAANLNTWIGQLPTWTATPTDTTKLIRQDTGGAISYGQVTFSTVYDYIKNKLAITNNNINLSRNTETTIATIGGTAIKIKLPASDNTDTKQNIVLATTTKAYLTGVTTAPTSTTAAMTGVGDTGVYLTSTAGELSAVRHSFNNAGTEKAYIVYNTTTNALDFVFV